jgi:transposase
MAAILFMARTSTPWALLPVGEFGCGSVTTCWRRFAEWALAGVFERLQEALLDDLPPVRTPAGRRRRRPDKCHADKAYDNRRCRAYLSGRGIKVRIARCGIESSTRLGRHRWKAERSIAWLAGCRRLRIRYDRDAERFFAFAMLACDRLCYNRLPCAAEAHARAP